MQGPNPSQDIDSSTNIMIFSAVSAVIVGIVIVIFVVVFIVGNIANNQPTTVYQYGVTKRPLPTANKLSDLLPVTLGTYKRGQITGTFQNFSAVYQNGQESVKISGSRSVSVQAAIASVTLIAESSGHTDKEALNTDPSYYLLVAANNGPARFAWSHNIWVFDAQAGTKTALDEFMKVFPY